MVNLRDRHLELDYPVRWEYTLIGPDRDALEQAVREVVQERDHELSLSNTSRRGTYVSLKLALTVYDEDDRQALFAAFSAHGATRYVL